MSPGSQLSVTSQPPTNSEILDLTPTNSFVLNAGSLKKQRLPQLHLLDTVGDNSLSYNYG